MVQNLRNHYTFGVFENGTLVGVVTLVRKTALKLRYKAKIVGVYVTPTKRKCGIAKRLLNEAIAKAKSMKGVEQVTLTVVSTNAAARNLYLNAGVKPFGLEKRALKTNGQYFDEEHMVLFLQ